MEDDIKFQLRLAITKALADNTPLLDAVFPFVKNWVEFARQAEANSEYYRGLLVQTGEILGEASYVADDGSRSEDVLVAAVPENVEELLVMTGQLIVENEALQADNQILNSILEIYEATNEMKGNETPDEPANEPATLSGYEWAEQYRQHKVQTEAAKQKQQSLIVSEYYSDNDDKMAIVKRDGYGGYSIDYFYAGMLMDSESFVEHELHTVEAIAETYVNSPIYDVQ